MDRPYYRQFVELAFKHDKMAFLSGPRRVGKTTLSEFILEKNPDGKYYNWDDIEFRRRWTKEPTGLIPNNVGKKSLVVFDEIHKAARWKTGLKGIYDLHHKTTDILVTGSARLDIFRKGGDSLLGRYFLARMHPFSIGEIEKSALAPKDIDAALNSKLTSSANLFRQLLNFGGFPEPFLKQDDEFINIWTRTRIERLVREDLLDITRSHEMALIETMVAMIPERVGSPLSLSSLSEDIEVSFPTVRRWLGWLSQLYYVYSVPPYAKNIARSLKKQPKIYLWEWREIEDLSYRFENLVGSHFLKACHHWTDTGVGTFELTYIRDKEKREVDFLILRDKKPWLMAECKMKDANISPHLIFYSKRLSPEIALQIIAESGVHERFEIEKGKNGFLISADALLRLLP